jgi:predicted alpha-1,2-mannosidase
MLRTGGRSQHRRHGRYGRVMRRPPSSWRFRSPTDTVAAPLTVALVTLAGLLVVTGTLAAGPAGRAAAAPPATMTDPAALVHPLDGTGTGPVSPGTVGEFPGADTPFGMIQWSPDTVPDAVQAGGGYADADAHLNGFSLTHLSGTGCPSYQDVPILPTTGPIGATPTAAAASFTHADEQASPGRYQVQLGPQPIGVSLAVTTRTGIAGFDFPAGRSSNVLLKVGDSANPATAARVTVLGHDEVEGQVTSGQFCGTGTNYTLSFVARFQRPFAAAGTWNSTGTAPGTSACSGPSCGAYVTFDTTAARQRQVLMKVGISFVSIADAAQNLKAEDPGWSVAAVATAAQRQWNDLLGRVQVGGGTAAEQHVFYTALYHSLLFPNVVSDVNGDYAGSDRARHRTEGRNEYANFSEWDVYRSEIQLESLVDPRAVGDMVQSLVDDAAQGGWLPKWAIVGGDESQMNGDSADPIIADAYAMGARNFDLRAALRAMVKGATQTESNHGLEVERQYLDQYLTQHYVDAGALDLTSIDYSIGGSATLEYALDDFAVAQIATAAGAGAEASSMRRRTASWEYLFNPATGYVQARGGDGSFPPGPAFEASQLEPGGQTGFEEGNAVQYTWSVPQDLAGLASLMGGDAAAVTELETYFTQLNATRDTPADWSGNEPSEWAPWEFDAFGAPALTQRTVRAIADAEYADAPVDEPGNDDLGALSSWYVWAAVGLFPLTPGTADLALASPLFPSVTIALPDGHRLVEHAPGAAASRPYVRALGVSGITRPAPPSGGCPTRATSPSPAGSWKLPWLPASALRTGGTLDFTLSASPSSWGTAAQNVFPSSGSGRVPAVGFSSPSGGLTLVAGTSGTLQLGAAPAGPGATTVHWQVASAPGGLQVTPSSGTLTLGKSCTAARAAPQVLTVAGTATGTFPLRITMQAEGGVQLPPVALDVTVHP